MAARSPGVDDAPNLTNEYNQHSIGKTIGHVLKHVVVMGAMMGVIGLAAAPVMAIPGLDPLSTSFMGATGPTPGDLIVQTAHGAGEMLNMIVDTFSSLISIGDSLITNVLDGNFAPSTWDSMVMSHSGEHMVMEAGHAATHGATEAGHAALHGATEAPSVGFDEWVRNAHASGELPYALEDSEALGITLEEHMMNEYGHAGH